MSEEMIKCACEECECVVRENEAVQQDGEYFCCEACAEGHLMEVGCGHEGCDCS